MVVRQALRKTNKSKHYFHLLNYDMIWLLDNQMEMRGQIFLTCSLSVAIQYNQLTLVEEVYKVTRTALVDKCTCIYYRVPEYRSIQYSCSWCSSFIFLLCIHNSTICIMNIFPLLKY